MAVVVKDRICKQCGKTFPGGPRAWYCPECRSERKKQQAAIRRQRPGPNRPLGSIDHCVVCGKEYVVKGGMQKYCEDCAKSAVAEKDRAAGIAYYHENKDAINPARYEKLRVKEKVCIVCGKKFDPHGLPAEMCSDECRRIRRRLQQYDAEKKRQKNKNGASNNLNRELYITISEYAEAAGIKYGTALKRILSGKIDGAVKIGSMWFIPKNFIDEYKIPDGFSNLRDYARASKISKNAAWYRASKGMIPGCVKFNGSFIVPDDEIKNIENKTNTDGYITIQQMADRNGVSVNTVRGWIYKNKLPGVVKINHIIYIPESDKRPDRKKHKKHVSRVSLANPPDGYITMTEYAKRRGISISAVSHSVSRGRITGTIKIGNQRFIPENQEEINKK